MIKPGTPSSTWHENGEPDPHGDRYDCEREDLMMGNLTDDQLANGVYMHGNVTPPIEQVVSGTAKMPIVWLDAAKNRIRWLSRCLQKREDQAENLAALVRDLARRLDKANPGNEKSRQAMVYLANNGFKADLLRKQSGRSNPHKGLCCEIPMYAESPVEDSEAKEIRAAIEAKAKEIYETWHEQPGYVPWVENGNSLNQDKARRLAHDQFKLG